ncbi:hypothetical protein, partial [Aliivibrio fischeri]|uniref:hypothetical protein n=1 Tax=Aliivibrio fischeri TaxID=668 RepID=UPI001BE4BB19
MTNLKSGLVIEVLDEVGKKGFLAETEFFAIPIGLLTLSLTSLLKLHRTVEVLPHLDKFLTCDYTNSSEPPESIKIPESAIRRATARIS